MRVFMVMGVTMAVMLALMANLLLKPKSTTKLASVMGWGANVLGFLLYGYGYAVLEDNVVMAALKTIYAVFGMFLGKNSMGDMQSLPFFSYSWVKLLLYLAQMFALYITASAAITVFGSNLLNRIRMLLARFGKLCLVYGVDDDTLRVGKEMTKDNWKVVFIGEGIKDADKTKIYQMRGVHVSDTAAMNAAAKFLRQFGIGEKEREIKLLAISRKPSSNIAYAEKLRASMEKAGVKPAGTSLTLCQEDGFDAAILQNTPSQYGYGTVLDFDMAEMSSRMMVLKHPPYKTIAFDDEGKATEDFEMMLIGFGRIGQAALKHLCMNGQFYGSTFKATVFDPSIDDIDGSFRYQYQGLLDHYHVELVDKDGRSLDAFEFLDKHASTLKYIVLATGDDDLNQEIGLSYAKVLNDLDHHAVLMEVSNSKGTRLWYSKGKVQTESWPLMSKELVDSDEIDERAKILNQLYMSWNGKTKEENWADCDYFSRESSRASADFMTAFAAIVAKTAGKKDEEKPAAPEEASKEAAKEGAAGEEKALETWELSDVMKENLGRTEHDRWVAFHYAHAYQPMSEEEWQKRADQYLKEKEETGKGKTRISKNTAGRRHACMIPWEDLPELDAKENAITGGHVEYQKMDIENVLAIPELLNVNKAKKG